MSKSTRVSLGALLLSASVACGGSSDGGISGLSFAGTIQISGAGTGNTVCEAASTETVTYRSTGEDRNSVNLVIGGCLTFVNEDSRVRQPGPAGATPCAELTGGPLSQGQSRTAGPFSGPRTCLWQDELQPPPAGSGGGY